MLSRSVALIPDPPPTQLNDIAAPRLRNPRENGGSRRARGSLLDRNK